MYKALYIISSCLLLQACSNSFIHDNPPGHVMTMQDKSHNSAPSQSSLDNQQANLIGQWETTSVESNLLKFTNAQKVVLCVYSYEEYLRDPGIQMINAELLVQEPGKQLQLVVDAQPVGQTGNSLYFGPIGSAYLFKYTVLKDALFLDLVSNDGAYLRLHFHLTSSNPGPMRFPPRMVQ